jgi:hypothetical protein
MWVIAIHSLFLCSDLLPPRHPLSDWLRLFFEPKHFPYKYPNHFNPVTLHTYPPMKMEQTQCSETSAFKLQTPGNNPEENIRHSEQGEILKPRAKIVAESHLQNYSSHIYCAATYKIAGRCEEKRNT